MENFDLYNYDRTLSGKTIERGNPVPDGYYRLVVVVLIFNSKGELLIQQRQSYKKKLVKSVGRFQFGPCYCGRNKSAGGFKRT